MGAAYGALFRALIDAPRPPATEALAGALAAALLLDENPLSRVVQAAPEGRAEGRAGTAPLPAVLLAGAASDLRTLQALAGAGPLLPGAVASATGLPQTPPWWDAPPGDVNNVKGPVKHQQDWVLGFARRLALAPDWGALAPDLARHYARHGSGPFARYRAFRWAGPEGGLVPVPSPDAVRPQDLIGYAPERALLRRNTVQFLAGYPANNLLLYGDRGTGKSSSVKALLHEPGLHEPGPRRAPDRTADAGEGVDWSRLRLIEVPKGRLADFPAIVALLRGRPQRFILFVDDLSFEEGETEYKDMKAMLEGGLEARPPNAVVYATSNRRHLIREQFADRPAPGTDEVHAMDTVQEKLSFADRFGLTITFPSPSQAAYLAIVEGLARQRGLTIEPAALRARAIEWAAWHNGRSGRTARQFVDYLAGEVGLATARATAAPAPAGP
ncbi:MAG TPA: ATP-binding protein [Chloroflexota bacterium]|nr:ATP-binding protein [Chloroflexota bacterium]